MLEPQPGAVLMVYAHDLIDRGIDAAEDLWLLRKGIKPPPGLHIYSHCAVYIGNRLIIEALGAGLTISPASKYRGVADVWDRPVSAQARKRMVDQAKWLERRKIRYAFLDIPILFLRLVFGLNIPWRSFHEMVCSAFVYAVWFVNGLKVAARSNCAPEEIAVYGTLNYCGKF